MRAVLSYYQSEALKKRGVFLCSAQNAVATIYIYQFPKDAYDYLSAMLFKEKKYLSLSCQVFFATFTNKGDANCWGMFQLLHSSTHYKFIFQISNNSCLNLSSLNIYDYIF